MASKAWPPLRPKSLIVYGDTRLGKSDFAKNLGPHVSFRNNFDLKHLLSVGIDNIDYVIFDDIEWDEPILRGSGYKAWLGGQPDFTCTDKYSKKATIQWGKPCIFLTNKNPFQDLHPRDTAWLEENCFVVDVGTFDPANRWNAISSGDCYNNQ